MPIYSPYHSGACGDSSFDVKEVMPIAENGLKYISSVSEDLNNPIVYNSGGYVNYPNNLISGFANRTYFSLSEYSLLETTENNASIEFGTNEKEDLKPGVLYSNFSNNSSDNTYSIIPI